MTSLSATLSEALWMHTGYKDIDGSSRKKLPTELLPSLNVKCKNWAHSLAPAATPAVLPLPTPYNAESSAPSGLQQGNWDLERTLQIPPDLGICILLAVQQQGHLPSMPVTLSPAQLQRKFRFWFMMRILIGCIAAVPGTMCHVFRNFFEINLQANPHTDFHLQVTYSTLMYQCNSFSFLVVVLNILLASFKTTP